MRALRLLVLSVMTLGVVFGQSGTGYLKVKAKPSDAGVFVDGKYLGPAAHYWSVQKYPVAAGKHTLELTDARHTGSSQEITIDAGKTLTVTATLTAKPVPTGPFGTIKIKNPDHFAAVYLNGTFVGHVDEFDNFAQGLLVPAGEYTVKIAPSNGSAAIEKKIVVQANAKVVVE